MVSWVGTLGVYLLGLVVKVDVVLASKSCKLSRKRRREQEEEQEEEVGLFGTKSMRLILWD